MKSFPTAIVQCVPFGFQSLEMCEPQSPVTVTEVNSSRLWYTCMFKPFFFQRADGEIIILENVYLRAVLKSGVLTSLVLKHGKTERLVHLHNDRI